MEAGAPHRIVRTVVFADGTGGGNPCPVVLARESRRGGDGWNTWTIAQGRAMGRPSLITAESRRTPDGVTATRVGGTMRVLES